VRANITNQPHAAGSLGFSARARDETCDLFLGETLCFDIKPNSQAEAQGVRDLDVIVAVNGEYTAFLSHESCLKRLTVQTRPLNVIFARPVLRAWNLIVKSGTEEIVKTGLLEKDHIVANFFARGFQARQFVLTKGSLSYSDNGVVKKKYLLEEILKILPIIAGAPLVDRDRVFQLVAKDKDVELRAGSFMDKLAWMHAIECVKHRAFDRVCGQNVMPPATSMSSGPPALPPRPLMVDKGLYWMLQKSNIKVSSQSGDSATAFPVLPPMPSALHEGRGGMYPSVNGDASSKLMYDFDIERKVMAQRRGV
jgi:hypothetical protein